MSRRCCSHAGRRAHEQVGRPSTRAMPVMARTAPVQNEGHLPGAVSAGRHVLTYGLRTISGTAGGRTGVMAAAAA